MTAKSRTFRNFERSLLEFCDSTPDELAELLAGNISDEALAMLGNKGSRIGSTGAYRCVYEHNGNPDLVIKAEVAKGRQSSGAFNKAEADAWNALKNTAIAKWFAPVRWISPCGFVMTQDRAEVFPKGVPQSKFPKMMPGIFMLMDDMHNQNFGFLGNQIVAVDYPDNNVPHYLIDSWATEMMHVGFAHPGSPWPIFTSERERQRMLAAHTT